MDTKKKIIISVLCGILAIGGVYSYIKHKEIKLLEMSTMTPVVIASKDILQHTQIDETMLDVKKVPKLHIQPGAILGNDIHHVLGQVTASPIMKGEQILGTKLLRFGRETGLAMKIPAGLRAISVLVDEVTGVAGLIKPNDFVDILTTFDFGNEAVSKEYTYTLFQNVSVLAVDIDLGEGYASLAKKKTGLLDKLEDARSGTSHSVTLAVTPSQAQDIVLAQETGVITLSLRGIGESEQELNLPATTPAKITGLKSLTKQQKKPRYQEYRGRRR
jgi:pilus assembly protein CpaB